MAQSAVNLVGIELWDGIEVKVNRVGDVFHSQLEWNGNDARAGDIERCISLGIQALRYPILSERAPTALGDPSWDKSDASLRLYCDAACR